MKELILNSLNTTDLENVTFYFLLVALMNGEKDALSEFKKQRKSKITERDIQSTLYKKTWQELFSDIKNALHDKENEYLIEIKKDDFRDAIKYSEFSKPRYSIDRASIFTLTTPENVFKIH